MTIINGNYREFELDNGLKVMLQNTSTQTIGGRLRVNFGALNENPGEEGQAHFLEHNLLTGGSSKYSPEEVDKIKSAFGSYNALTGLSETTFPVDMLAEDLELYLDFVSSVAFDPLLDPTRFEEERQRVLRETADFKGSPNFKCDKLYKEVFLGKDSPHGYFVLGDEDVIRSVTPDQMRMFHSRGYGAANMDLILAGALPDNAEALINENFGNRKRGRYTKFDFPRNSPLERQVNFHLSAPELLNEENPQESNAQLNISLFTSTRSDPDSYAVQMLVDILGADGNSRLFQRISRRMGLAYRIGSNYDFEDNVGEIYIGGSIEAKKSEETIDAVFDEMKKLRENLVHNDQLERNKRVSRYSISKMFESNYGHVNAILLKHDKGITPESHLEKYGAVTPQDVQEAAIKYFPTSREDGKYVLMLRDPLKNFGLFQF